MLGEQVLDVLDEHRSLEGRDAPSWSIDARESCEIEAVGSSRMLH
jgi:hypothetical protein